MKSATELNDPVDCSFCTQRQDQVRTIVAGPNVWLCDDCVHQCSALILEESRG
jgi:ATP-dependent Clp protease ATP-binding subunit ClpX